MSKSEVVRRVVEALPEVVPSLVKLLQNRQEHMSMIELFRQEHAKVEATRKAIDEAIDEKFPEPEE